MVLQNVSMSPLIITGGGQSSTIVLLRLLYSCIDVIKSKDFACEILGGKIILSLPPEDHPSALYKREKASPASSAIQAQFPAPQTILSQAGMVDAVEHLHQFLTVCSGLYVIKQIQLRDAGREKSFSMMPALA